MRTKCQGTHQCGAIRLRRQPHEIFNAGAVSEIDGDRLVPDRTFREQDGVAECCVDGIEVDVTGCAVYRGGIGGL